MFQIAAANGRDTPFEEEIRMTEIKFHSITSLITNSSTTIYTNSDASVEACKLMINEVLKVLGSTLSVDDMFTVQSRASVDVYLDLVSDYCTEDVGALKYDERKNMIERILNGKNEKPSWFSELENKVQREIDNEQRGTELVLLAKNEKYTRLADAVCGFLRSTEAFEVYE